MIPNRPPFVRETTYLDGFGPPPFAFYDETQDALIAAQQAATGWTWASHQEDFAGKFDVAFRLGQFRYTGVNTTVTRTANTGAAGEVQVAPTLAGLPMTFRAATAESHIAQGKDFLFSARITVIARAVLQPAVNFGCWIGLGDSSLDTQPGICCGSDTGTWRISTPLRAGDAHTLVDTKVPVLDGRPYTLQICRKGGVQRFFINGTLIRLPTPAGTDTRDGVYLPDEIVGAVRLMLCNQVPTAATSGFRVDFFHALIQRV